MPIRALGPDDAAEFHALRLRGLAELPGAFASSYEEEVTLAPEEVARRLEHQEGGSVFGSFDGGVLCGVVGIQRESMAKLRHKAVLWGLYVAPEARRSGHGAALISHALQHAWSCLRVRQVNLGASTVNDEALRLYRRLGFEVFGTERGAMLVDGQPQDEHHMVCRARGVP